MRKVEIGNVGFWFSFSQEVAKVVTYNSLYERLYGIQNIGSELFSINVSLWRFLQCSCSININLLLTK